MITRDKRHFMKAVARAIEIFPLTVTVSEVASSVRQNEGGDVSHLAEYVKNITYKWYKYLKTSKNIQTCTIDD